MVSIWFSYFHDTVHDETKQKDYNKTVYSGSGSQQSKGQNISNPPPSGTGSDISSSIYGNKSHAALNKVNVGFFLFFFFLSFDATKILNKLCEFIFQSYEKQSFHSGTPPPFNLAGTQATGATSQAYGQQLYIQAMPAALHNMNMHQQMHQVGVFLFFSSTKENYWNKNAFYHKMSGITVCAPHLFNTTLFAGEKLFPHLVLVDNYQILFFSKKKFNIFWRPILICLFWEEGIFYFFIHLSRIMNDECRNEKNLECPACDNCPNPLYYLRKSIGFL